MRAICLVQPCGLAPVAPQRRCSGARPSAAPTRGPQAAAAAAAAARRRHRPAASGQQQEPEQQQQPGQQDLKHQQQPEHEAAAGAASSSATASSAPAIAAALLGAAALFTAVGSPVAGQTLAMEMGMGMSGEPANALSLPTWMVHVSSVVEWVVAMGLMWRYGEVSGNPRWKGMAWGMLPCLGSAMCACTWHFFYNSPDLQFLVAVQAALTVAGNCTCWLAAYRIYTWAQENPGQQV